MKSDTVSCWDKVAHYGSDCKCGHHTQIQEQSCHFKDLLGGWGHLASDNGDQSYKTATSEHNPG